MKSISKFALAASIGLALTFTLSCSGDDGEGDSGSSSSGGTQGGVSSSYDGGDGGSSSSAVQCLDTDSGTFTDDRDGKEYKYVTICSQIWMAENLNYNVEGSKCGNESSGKLTDNETDCTKYGRLYDWNTALTVCPSGWHLPSNAEWDALMTAVGGASTAGTKLKATSGWNSNGNGTNNYGFSALPGGRGNPAVTFYDAGNRGGWWSASERNSDYANLRLMLYDFEVAPWDNDGKSRLYSVRCIKD